MREIGINFCVAGPGWGDLEFRIADRSFVAAGISFTKDAIGDLLRAAIMVATGAKNATVSFDREPAEWRLRLDSLLDVETGLGPLQIRVLEFADFHAASPEKDGFEVFKVSCPALEFCRAILESMDVKNTESFESPCGYPLAAYRSLKAAMEVYGDRRRPSANS